MHFLKPNHARGIVTIWVFAFSLLILIFPAYADPLDRLAVQLPGAEIWWNPPGSHVCFSESHETGFSLTWAGANLVRYKSDNELRYLLTSSGPVLDINYSNPHSCFTFSYLLHDVDVLATEDGFSNRLIGERTIAELDAYFDIPMDDGSNLIIAARWNSLRLQTDGALPTLTNGIPGLEKDESTNLDWREDGWMFAGNYRTGGSSIGLVYGQTDNSIDLESSSPEEEVRLSVQPSGYTIGLTGEMQLDTKTMGQAFYRVTRNYGEHGVYRRDDRLGPLRASMDSWCYGFKFQEFSDLPRWNLALIHGIYSTNIYGSANISSFGEPVFGIITPRVHIDTDLRLALSTVLFERDVGRVANADTTCFFGLTRWDLEGGAKTWESYLFGGATLNESTSELDVESGWLLHAGLNTIWELTPSNRLSLFIGQTIPISTERAREPSPPILPEPEHREIWDGGRYMSLSFIHSF